MLLIKIKENESIDQALKRYKKKYKKTKVIEEIRSRSEYVKPSMKRRKEIIKARYKTKVLNQ